MTKYVYVALRVTAEDHTIWTAAAKAMRPRVSLAALIRFAVSELLAGMTRPAPVVPQEALKPEEPSIPYPELF